MSQEFVELPTGKCHISFSELSDWVHCPWRHKKKHIEKIDLSKPGPALEFGKAVHSSCENFLKTREMKIDIAIEHIKAEWQKNDFPNVNVAIEEATKILNDVPQFINETFPNWEFIEAEHQLYEQIDDTKQAFKGFIDGIIKTTVKNKDIYHIIDWKTCGFGWTKQQMSDPVKRSQLVYYKAFWSKKNPTINEKNIRCAFILLKRTVKKNHCQLIPVSVGDVTKKRSLDVIQNMIWCITNNSVTIKHKNESNCKFCDYKDTEHCK